jgi:thioredoxin 1
MKKAGMILIAVSGLFLGCGSKTETGQSVLPTTATGIKAGNDKGATAGSEKPENLTARTFREKVMDYEKNPKQWVFEGNKPCIVDFYADWCRPCRMVAPIMEELALEYKGRINFYKVDTDKERELAAVFNITSLPTVLFVPVTGQPSAQTGAMQKDDYKQVINEMLLKSGKKLTN